LSVLTIAAVAVLTANGASLPVETLYGATPTVIATPQNIAQLQSFTPPKADEADQPVTVSGKPPVNDPSATANAPALPVIQVPPGGTEEEAATPNPSDPVDDETIVVSGRARQPKVDPAEAINEVSFIAVQAVDTAIIAPVTHGYMKAVPTPIRSGLHNVLNNLDEPIVFVNFLLQLKVGKAFETVGRFLVNSTLGVGGLFDVAKKKPFNLPRRSNGLADTLGYYGVGPGPYLFLPLIGSTSVRDLLGRVADLSLLPTAVAKPFAVPLVSISKGALSSLDDRVENDDILTRVKESDDPYAAMREYYLKKRAAEIDVLKGKRANADIDLNELTFLKKTIVPAEEIVVPEQTPPAQPAEQQPEVAVPDTTTNPPADAPASLPPLEDAMF
jgi:phospholipid-binding lipoprotein MlaA